MEPRKKNKRQQYPGGEYVQVNDLSQWSNDNSFDTDNELDDNIFAPMDFDDIDADTYDGNATSESYDVNTEMTKADEDRRIEALKRAIDIAKLMSNVTIEGILAIGEQVDKYLREN